MPYALRDCETGQLLACMQVNGYQLAYYGVRLWESEPDQAAAAEALAAAGIGWMKAGNSGAGSKPDVDGSGLQAEGRDGEGRIASEGGSSFVGADGLAVRWQPVELTEHQAKLANVKLRNDPRRRVYLLDNVLSASIVEN